MTTTVRNATERTAPTVWAALVPSLIIGSACVSVGLVAAGTAGGWGAGIGAMLVVGFFWLGQAALNVVRFFAPGLFLVFALLTYLLQVVLLLAVFASFQRNPGWSDRISPTALGLTVIACTVAWTVGLIVADRQQRTPLYDDGGGAR